MASQSTSGQPLLSGEQYLSFMLDDEEYGVDILRVQEVRGWTPVTRLPASPPYIKGVLNLRGAIVPVVDLRECFGFPVRPYGPTTVVVVVRALHEDQERVIGLVVDAVAETYHIDADQIRPAPRLESTIRPDFIAGLATVEERMIVMLDLDHLLSADELALDGVETEDE